MTLPDTSNRDISATRDAIHAYSRVIGAWAKKSRLKRKHWWHISLRPSLRGLTTGVIYADPDFEIELNLQQSCLVVSASRTNPYEESLHGQSAAELAENIRTFLVDSGVDSTLAPDVAEDMLVDYPGYSVDVSESIFEILRFVSKQMEAFRASIREETSPIQLWPHHFDLSMLWLPGSRIPDQDPDNEEYADKQMNFGFTFGDTAIPEPYFYITAYPLPDSFPSLSLPDGTSWYSDSFTGAVLLYNELLKQKEPGNYLHRLWSILYDAGHDTLLN